MHIPENNPLYKLQSKKKLAKILSIDEVKKIKDIEKYFSCNPVLKQIGKKERLLYNPHREYKRILRKVQKYLQNIEFLHYVFGGIKHRDYRGNALYHQQQQYVCKIDISNFFPSTRAQYVFAFFKNKMKMSPDIAAVLTQLTTRPCEHNEKLRHLPQGFPTSPVLSYLCYFDMFNGIYNLAQQADIKVSLFIDDMTFSSDQPIQKGFISRIKHILLGYGLELNKTKVYFYSSRQHKKITGVIIRQDGEVKAPNSLQQSMYRNFQDLLEFKNGGTGDMEEMQSKLGTIKGQICSIQYIEPNRRFPYVEHVIKRCNSLTKLNN